MFGLKQKTDDEMLESTEFYNSNKYENAYQPSNFIPIKIADKQPNPIQQSQTPTKRQQQSSIPIQPAVVKQNVQSKPLPKVQQPSELKTTVVQTKVVQSTQIPPPPPIGGSIGQVPPPPTPPTGQIPTLPKVSPTPSAGGSTGEIPQPPTTIPLLSVYWYLG